MPDMGRMERYKAEREVPYVSINECWTLLGPTKSLHHHIKRAGHLKFIDTLPHGPAWHYTQMTVEGDELDAKGNKKVEVLELWHRDPIECIAELLGNPSIEHAQHFKPRGVFRRADRTGREYDEMWTANWWWEIQDLLPEDATIVPIILASDKTQLSTFCGYKQAWPVYISIGNIKKAIRRQPSSHAMILLGYIPALKLDCISKARRQFQAYQIFHDCMRVMLQPNVATTRKVESLQVKSA
ncbi:hypothetical protein MVEN_02546900 [Mycena venus]|uniref:Uncharacterized protein n=1 Tax=Mycena venus TaxID=2733690 RepID=A0A8H6U4Y2_9AGAR|nr:hypothetical protein MVEN_02546900 [Mycena venus]